MTDLAFQTSTRRTGIRRIVRVRIIEDRDRFRTAATRAILAAGGHLGQVPVEPDGWQADAYTIAGTARWSDRDARPHQATILFWGPVLDAGKIAHEAAHAALHIYSIDQYREHARAAAHVHIGNEVIPYIVGDLTTAICERVLRAGVNLTPGKIERGAPI